MMVEGDDGRRAHGAPQPRSRGGRGGRRGRGACRRRRRPRRRPDRAPAGAHRCPRRPPSRRSGDRDGRPAGRRDEHLVGREPAGLSRSRSRRGRRPAPGAGSDRPDPAGRRPVARTGRARSPRPRPPSGRRPGKASSPVSSGRRSGTRPAGPSAAADRITSSGVAPSSVNGPEAVRVSAPRYAALPRPPPRSRASARTYVPAEQATSTTAIGRSGVGGIPGHEVERVDRDLPARELDGLAGPRDARRPGGRRP